MPARLLAVLLLALAAPGGPEHVREMEVSEGAPVGTRVGFIGDGSAGGDSGPPYLIIPVPGSAVDSDLAVEQTTGEIRTKVPLDREARSSYSLVAIPLAGENVRVVVRVLDENDNAPTFPSPVMSIEFPENTPRDVKRTLHPARDLDLGVFNTQRYNIVSGNVNNAFRLSSHRERDGVLYLDLQINGFLDRESIAAYSLVIEALDGGTPPLRGVMTVNITIQDVNDNQPIFSQNLYTASVPENATVGTSVLQVFATDTDAGLNGEVEYSINRRQSDRDGMFRIDSATGLIAVNRPLDFETKDVHELVVVARDKGEQPLETTAFVSIKVTDVNDNQPTINVIFLSDDATPKISESAQPGEFVARISVNDPDSKTEYSNVNVTLEGGDGKFGLATRDHIIYLVIVANPLDRELQPNYTLSVIATDTGNPPLHASRTFHLLVTDVNDNAPEFEQNVYHADVLEVAEPGTSVIQVQAVDKDEGNNSAIIYSIADIPGGHSSWFRIDSRSGLISTRNHVDCEADPMPQVIVVAVDNGAPPLSSSATVMITIHDVNDNEPIFDQSFYNVSVPENEAVGRCVIKVSATDPDCGVNALVNYTLGEGFGRVRELEVRPATGEVCVAGPLDFESRAVYEFPVIATDRGGLSTTAMVKVQLVDVNDNPPRLYPQLYNVSLREGAAAAGSPAPLVAVAASDPDSGRYGAVSFKIVAGNEAGVFRVDKTTGEVFVARAGQLSSRATYHLNISATDGGGLRAPEDAEVYLSVADAAHTPPVFERARYAFSVREDVVRGTAVGSVRASGDIGGHSPTHYSIYSGDPDGLFTVDSLTGAIRTAFLLDHETRPAVLLNVMATNGDPPTYGHSQVHITIEDVNDNAPEFDSRAVRISVPENAELGAPLYAAHARDRDSGRNGLVRYRLASPGAGLFGVDPRQGHLTLLRSLDYESAQRHTVVIVASDSGEPPRSANLTVVMEVQDVNDNPPVFQRSDYSVSVLESLPVDSQVVQVSAVDLDTGNNARLTYRLLPGDNSSVFGVSPNSGWVFLRRPLDREARDRYALRVVAADNGNPSGSATARVSVTVLDANDNDPAFSQDGYEFWVEENRPRGAVVGRVKAADPDLEANGAVRYSLIPANTSFSIHPVTGEITTRAPLDREKRARHELVAEARDQGTPPRGARVAVSVKVADVNDNSPELVDPREDVVSVREEQSAGTEVVRLRAVDRDAGENATVTYSLLKGRDSDGHGVFSVDPLTGVVKTTAVLDHEDKAIYRLEVAAKDSGNPPRQAVRLLRVEVLDLNDNRPTFTSSSLVFRVREDVRIGHVVGTVVTSDPGDLDGGHVSYTLTSVNSSEEEPEPEDNSVLSVFDMDRTSGSLVVARQLDREARSEYRLEVRALDTSASNNPQSSAVSVRVEVTDVNDNPPRWARDPVVVAVAEDSPVGAAVWNFTATDADAGANGEVRYGLVKQWPAGHTFSVDPLTGTLTLRARLDREAVAEYVLVVRAGDQSANATERLQSTVTARVAVRDVNDNAPVFTSPSGSGPVRVREGAPVGAALCHILASDRDTGENGRVTYELTAGDAEGIFQLDRDAGVLSLARPLGGGGATYDLNVTASDHGSPTPHRAHRTVRVMVLGAAGNPPRFPRVEYHANVSEDAGVGGYVIKVTARSAAADTTGTNNLSYSIPAGAADDRFAVDARTGVVSVRRPLDREARDRYAVPVFVSDATHAHADVATLWVQVADANDHPPEFRPGACYPLDVPENSDLSVIHTVVAADKDIGANAEITYTITGGNVGNRFSLDPHSGELTARPLDREVAGRYWLQVTAQDRGALRASCNVSVHVEDQNDNDPAFAQQRYAASVPEGAPPGTTVLVVRASDADLGPNARVVYSLANESDWLFRVDNRTGAITTAGPLDHERQSSYTFHVVATDGGRYDARSQRVPVHVEVTDVNDNTPVFTRYPFSAQVPAYTQPGQTLVRVTAHDADQGTNSEVVYSLVNEPAGGKFRINPNSGAVSAASSLAPDSGRLFHLQVLARDKGNPPRSSTGLVEIRVGDGPDNARLRFQNSTYHVYLEEGAARGTEVVQVSAVRTDGRRQRITYSIGAGNDDSAFDVDPGSGVIRVRDPHALDYEKSRELRLSVVAEGEAESPLFGYCEVQVHLQDRNDNSPQFTQDQYIAAVWEGNNKGTFVMQVTATDADEDGNSHVLYHIVDGNHDNAFVIEPPFSGLVKTNIVLDREIRDTYRLTVIATDEGNPQLTGTSTLRVTIIDVNDNPPTFPPHSVISVSEGTEVGAVLTTVRANDVDSNPALTYHFTAAGAEEGGDDDDDEEARATFSMDRFSGKVTLVRRLDFESRREYRLRVAASDTAHAAHTELRVRVQDVNDNRPQFSRCAYLASLPPDGSDPSRPLLAVNATDVDSGENGHVRYSLLAPAPRGFLVDPVTGAMYANRSAVGGGKADVQLAVVATDMGRPELSDVATVTVMLGEGSGQAATFLQHEYRVRVREDSPLGTTILKITTADQFSEESRNVVFHIIDGNQDGAFHVLSPSGELMLLKMLDRETDDAYTLRITAGDHNSSGVVVRVTVDDANDNPPVFQSGAGYSVSVSEGASTGHNILHLLALDADQPGTPNSEVVYEIASGNDEDLFSLDLKTGIIRVNKGLDYDTGDTHYMLVVQATDSANSPDTRLSNITTVNIRLEDDNDNTPVFPVPEYLHTVPENEPAGTAVFTATATDADKGPYGAVNYSVVPSQGLEDSWRLFRVDPTSGVITTAAVFDYEQRSRYTFTLQARDSGGREANVRVRIDVEGRDEFHPQFTERTYRFVLPSTHLPAGHILGHVCATDRDKGPDGRVVYQLTTQHSYFKVNRTTGAVMVRRKLDESFTSTEDISLVVTASSGWQGSLTNMTVVEITLDPLPKHDNELLGETLPAAGPGGLADWALGLLVTLVLIVLALGAVFLFLHMRNRRHKKSNKPALSSGGGGADGFVDTSAFDTIPIRGSGAPGGPGVQGVPPGSQFAPPKYDEIPPYPPVHRGGAGNNNSGSSNSGAATTSELSGSEQSGSSGRGSAEEGEDVEDEEIRMINEGGAVTGGRDNAGLDEDNLSDVSVRNTQEYLARLGIMVVDNPVTTSGPPPPPPPPLNGLHMFDEEGGGEADIANLIYAKLNDGGSASGGGSEDGGGGGTLEHAMVLSGFGDVPTHHQPSMTGSLSSIVHSEEELTGSYNWDYLLDWGPQYQPLAHVFSEIARLKDDAASVHSANSATSSSAGKGKIPPAQPIPPHPKTVPPPLLTSVAPRSLAAPRIGHLSSSVAGSVAPTSHRTSSLLALPRSPISHDATGQGFSTSAAMSPSFSPSLSPLATRSPSISPLVTPGVSLPRQGPQTQRTDPTELRI